MVCSCHVTGRQSKTFVFSAQTATVVVHVVQRCKGYGPSGSSFGFARLSVGRILYYPLQGEVCHRLTYKYRFHALEENISWCQLFFLRTFGKNLRPTQISTAFAISKTFGVWMHSGLPLPLSLFVDVNVEDTTVTTYLEPCLAGSHAGACVCCWHGLVVGYGPWFFQVQLDHGDFSAKRRGFW